MNNEDKLKEITDSDEVAISTRQLIGESQFVVNEIIEGCLYTGFYGTLDSRRIKKISDSILEISNRSDDDRIIIDLSNVDIIDSAIANHLIKLNKMLQLVGLSVIFCGLRPIVAQSMVNSGIMLENITVVKNLKAAIKEVIRQKGYKIVKMNKE